MKKSQVAIASCAVVIAAGLAATLPSAIPAASEARWAGGQAVMAVYGVASVTHHDADGNVLSEQEVRNRLLNTGEDYILQQVFSDGSSDDQDSAQIGAICLSADDTAIVEGLDQATFNSAHETDADTTVGGSAGSTIAASDTRECLADASVGMSGQVATIGPLTFTANNTATPDDQRSNWKPDVTIKMIGICKGFSDASAASCTAPLFAAVDINDVTLSEDETLTVTYTFDMSSNDD